MAKTGIQILVTDSVLGAPVSVNKNSALIFEQGAVTPQGVKFAANTLYKLTSVAGLAALGVTEANNPIVYEQVRDFYHPSSAVNNEGTILWIGFIDSLQEGADSTAIASLIAQSVANDFGERPRQIGFVLSFNYEDDNSWSSPVTEGIHDALLLLHENYDIRAVGIMNFVLASPDVESNYVGEAALEGYPTLANSDRPFCAVSIAGKNDIKGASFESYENIIDPAIGMTIGLLSSLSVATSIGDGTLPAMTEPLYVYALFAEGGSVTVAASVPCASLSKTTCNELGEKQYLFARTRPPRNGLWWNDGATANDPDNALSTLEMGRTICAIADDLQSFFVPYINSKVPVNEQGDIKSDYKQVVLGAARSSVIQRYIDSGDISDARINLVAKDNNMVGTRTWEVTLSILPAPTLRWIDGYVFYVKNLS